VSYLFYIYVHSSPYLFVCGDDLVGEPGDA